MRVIGRMVLDRSPDNFFAETEQVAFLPRQHRARHRLLRTIRCCRAGCSPTSTRSCRGWARPTSTSSRSTRRSARSRTSSATAICRCSVPKGRANYEPNSLAEPARSAAARRPGERLPQLRRADRRRRARSASAPRASPTTTARRACSSAPRPSIEQAHLASALVFELSKVEHAARARRDGRQPAQRRRGPRQARRRRPGHADLPPPRRRRRRLRSDHGAVAGRCGSSAR